MLLRRSRSFKVIEVGTNRKPVCDFLLVINSNWHPISYRFGVIAAYCSNFGVATSEKRSKIGDFASTRSVWSKISGRRGRPSPIIFARLVRLMYALQLCADSFHTKELCSRLKFLQAKWDFFYRNRPFSVFETLFGDLGATYDDHLRLIGKRVVVFLLALIELFSLGVTAEALRAIIGWKSAISLQWGVGWPKISGRSGRPPPTILLLRKLG